MSVDSTLDAITQLTEELGEIYSLQAELVEAEIAAQRDIVGEFKEWVCNNTGFLTCGDYYSETEPGGGTKFWHWPYLKNEPHSRQGEAMDELRAAQEQYDTTETEQMDRQEKLATIPTDLGGFLRDWFAIDTSFAAVYFPANANEVPGSGQSWLGSASGGYDSAMGTQRSAADTAKDVVGGLITNSSAFLGEVTDTMGNLTELALAQEQLYLDAFNAGFQDYTSIGGFISAIKDIAQVFQSERELFFDRVDEQGRQLAAAVDSVIQVGLLANDLTGIGPGGNWPDPQNVASDTDNPGSPSRDEIVADATWFKTHIAYWDDIESDMTSLKTSADGAATLPIKIIDMPHFSALQSNALNGLAEDLTAAIGGGKNAAGKVSDGLTTTIRNYIENELGAGADAEAFFNQHVGG